MTAEVIEGNVGAYPPPQSPAAYAVEALARCMFKAVCASIGHSEEAAACVSGDDWHQFIPDANKAVVAAVRGACNWRPEAPEREAAREVPPVQLTPGVDEAWMRATVATPTETPPPAWDAEKFVADRWGVSSRMVCDFGHIVDLVQAAQLEGQRAALVLPEKCPNWFREWHGYYGRTGIEAELRLAWTALRAHFPAKGADQ